MSEEKEFTTPLMPHKVLSRKIDSGNPSGITFTENEFAGIVFAYRDVKFVENPDEDKLVIKFDYEVLDVPESLEGYDKQKFEKILGDFVVQLLYYGLERDCLGFIDNENRNNYSD